MSADIWDTPGMSAVSGAYVKWEEPGETVIGDVTGVTLGEDLNGRPCPVISLRTDDGDDRIISASQAMLKGEMARLRPVVGDRIKVSFDRTEKRDGGKTLKVFTVAVTPGGAKGTVAAVEEPF